VHIVIAKCLYGHECDQFISPAAGPAHNCLGSTPCARVAARLHHATGLRDSHKTIASWRESQSSVMMPKKKSENSATHEEWL
jgi:hypothetical protein